jgi:hypothetical protein
MIFIEVRCDKCGSVGLSRRCFYAHQLQAPSTRGRVLLRLAGQRRA